MKKLTYKQVWDKVMFVSEQEYGVKTANFDEGVKDIYKILMAAIVDSINESIDSDIIGKKHGLQRKEDESVEDYSKRIKEQVFAVRSGRSGKEPIEFYTDHSIVISMNQEQAQWLKNIMQNELSEGESIENSDMRKLFWDSLPDLEKAKIDLICPKCTKPWNGDFCNNCHYTEIPF